MVEELFSKLEYSHHLNETTRVDLSLVGEGDLDLSHKTHSNLDSLLRYHFALGFNWSNDTFTVLLDSKMWLNTVLRAQLNDLVFEDSITHLVTSHFSEAVD